VTDATFRFLSIEDVLELHEMQLEAFGGLAGIRDRSLLESAIAMPEATFGGTFVHSGHFEKAAAYAFHIAQNQPFVDGNKRTALHAPSFFWSGMVIQWKTSMSSYIWR
jgi:death-on-curing protein